MGDKVKYNDFKKLFFNPKMDKRDLLERVKHSIDDYEELLKFIAKYRSGMKSATSLLNNSLYGKNPLPKTYDDLNKNGKRFQPTSTIKKELNWLVACLIDFKKEINHFVVLQKDYEDRLFKGDYKEARSILDKIECEICVSFWSIENRFILDEYEFGTEENWSTRKLFIRDGIDPFVQSFSNIFSIRAERTISFYQFNNEMEKWLDVQGIAGQSEYYDLNEYLRFKGNFFSFTNYSRYASLLYQETGASVVDKYIIFKRVCSHLILDVENKEFIVKLLNAIYAGVDDPVLRNLLVYENSEAELKKYPYDEVFLNIVDIYTEGRYEEVILNIQDYFSSSTNGELQILELYVKSLCETGSVYKNISTLDCILDDIGSALHEVLMKTEKTEDSLIELVNYSYLFSNTRHGSFIYSFVSKQLGWKGHLNYEFIHSSNSSVVNPLMLLSSIGVGENYIDRISSVKSSISVKLISENFDASKLTEGEIKNIPETKLKLYEARHLVQTDLIQNAKEIYLDLLEAGNISIIAQFEVCSELFKCYLEEEEYREAIKLFVKINSKNPHLTKKMSFDQVINGVVKGKFKNVGDKSDLIELPIFFKINSNDRIRIKQSMELFLRSVNCKKPSELIKNVDNYSRENVLYFFKNVCSSEILQLSKSFTSTFLVNEERISICKYLTEFDEPNSKKYREEITDLTLKNTISKVIGKIDERKIYVNESKLKQNIRKLHKQSVFQNESQSPLNNDSFKRYVKLHKYIKENNEYRNISPVSFNEQGEVEVNDESFLDKYDVVFYYPAFQIFSTFFLHIRDLFVFNKENGLDTYLSTKIRHGTLPNHLRSVFETSYLVTTQSNESYVDNEYWSDKLNLTDSEDKVVQKLLSNFSINVDEFSKRIKDIFIQCQSEINSSSIEGEFNYSYSEEDQIQLYIAKFHSVYDIDEFIELVFQEFWSRTELILENIRNKFNGEYKDFYVKYLDQLEKGLLDKFERDKVNELLSQIMTCRTDIQHKLNSISQWFRRSESSYEGDYEVNVLAQTSVEITKNLNPTNSFDIKTKLDSSSTVKGEYHEHFIDMLNNCLFNIIEHSHLESNERNARMNIFEEDDIMILKFSNNVHNISEHVSKLEEIKRNWNQLDSNIAEERGTGFPKVKKIIVSDLNRKISEFNYKIEENNIEIQLSFELKDL